MAQSSIGTDHLLIRNNCIRIGTRLGVVPCSCSSPRRYVSPQFTNLAFSYLLLASIIRCFTCFLVVKADRLGKITGRQPSAKDTDFIESMPCLG